MIAWFFFRETAHKSWPIFLLFIVWRILLYDLGFIHHLYICWSISLVFFFTNFRIYRPVLFRVVICRIKKENFLLISWMHFPLQLVFSFCFFWMNQLKLTWHPIIIIFFPLLSYTMLKMFLIMFCSETRTFLNFFSWLISGHSLLCIFHEKKRAIHTKKNALYYILQHS